MIWSFNGGATLCTEGQESDDLLTMLRVPDASANDALGMQLDSSSTTRLRKTTDLIADGGYSASLLYGAFVCFGVLYMSSKIDVLVC